MLCDKEAAAPQSSVGLLDAVEWEVGLLHIAEQGSRFD